MTEATSYNRSGPSAMRAGYDAYYAAYSTGYFGANHKPHRQSSPYSNKIQAKQWEKGWQSAQRNHETGKLFSHDPFKGVSLGYLAIDPQEKQNRQREAQRKQAEFNSRQKVKHTPWAEVKAVRTGRTQSQQSNVSNTPKDAVNLRRLDKFNKKYRTKV